jgi:hypothetical protein
MQFILFINVGLISFLSWSWSFFAPRRYYSAKLFQDKFNIIVKAKSHDISEQINFEQTIYNASRIIMQNNTDAKKYTTFTRLEAHEKWTDMLKFLSDNVFDVQLHYKVSEFSKDMFYSGLPDQVCELYLAYSNILLQKSNFSVNIYQDINNPVSKYSSLICLTNDTNYLHTVMRSLINLAEIKQVQNFYFECQKLNLLLTDDLTSLLIVNLATHSSLGFTCAKKIYDYHTMQLKRKLGTSAFTALLKGLWMFTLDEVNESYDLLLDPYGEAQDSIQGTLIPYTLIRKYERQIIR